MLNAQGTFRPIYMCSAWRFVAGDAERSQRDKVLQLFDRYIIADDVESPTSATNSPRSAWPVLNRGMC